MTSFTAIPNIYTEFRLRRQRQTDIDTDVQTNRLTNIHSESGYVGSVGVGCGSEERMYNL